MDVIVHKRIDSLEKIWPKSQKLKKNFREITIFQDINWIESWWEYKSKQKDIEPYVIEIRDRNKTIGVIALYSSWKKIKSLRFRVLKPMGDELSDYLIPILSKEHSSEIILRKAIEKIYEDKLNWDFIEWGDIPENSFFDDFLRNQLKENSFIERKRTDACPFLLLSRNVEEVKQKFSKKFLKGILYYERKLNRIGTLNYHKVVTEQEIEPIMNKLFEFHIERWRDTTTPSRFTSKNERKYTMLTAKKLFKDDLLHLSYLSHNNDIAAVEFGMADSDTRYLYNGAFNHEFIKYPVGHILLYRLIIEACQEGYETMDFLRGDESYKQRAGTNKKYNVKYVLFNDSIKSFFIKTIYHTYQSKFFRLYIQKIIDKRALAKAAKIENRGKSTLRI